MKLASMAGMQVDPVPEESAKLTSIDGYDPENEIAAVPAVSAGALDSDVLDDNVSAGMDRFVRYLESQKKSKNGKTQGGRAIRAYEAQKFKEEGDETKGMRLDKAG